MVKVEPLIEPTDFIDSDEPSVVEYASRCAGGAKTPVERAVRLFYAVRDGIEYDLLKVGLKKEEFKASRTLARGYGFCIHKAVLLAALCRAQGIPSRLRFADVRNHLTTDWLMDLMETDLFIYHGYVEMLLDDRWVKSTPAFDSKLCERHRVRPIEFDGVHHAVFHEFDMERKKHMEYVREHGVFEDLPYDRIVEAVKRTYPKVYDSDAI